MRGATTLLSIAVAVIPAFAGDPPNVRDYEERCVNYYARQYGVSAALVRAVIQVESAWQPGAVSPKGAMGLMQLMPGTAALLGVDAHNVADNILGGAKFLRALLLRYNGNPALALAAYNAGPGAVQKYNGVPPYMETHKYIIRVLQEYKKLQDRKARAGGS